VFSYFGWDCGSAPVMLGFMCLSPIEQEILDDVVGRKRMELINLAGLWFECILQN
jgi:hypothetical protein